MSESDSARDVSAVSQARYQLHQCGPGLQCDKNSTFTERCSWHTSLPPHTRQADVWLRCSWEDNSSIARECPMNQKSTPTPETQDKVKANLPAHSQEHCTQKACRPPSLQRLCNITVEEKTRTLLKGFSKDSSQEKFYSQSQEWFCLDPRSVQEATCV